MVGCYIMLHHVVTSWRRVPLHFASLVQVPADLMAEAERQAKAAMQDSDM